MAQRDAMQSDVVKKGVLKYRASKVKRTSGSSAQGPKSAKPLFIVFRALRTGDKVLHMYTNDRKYLEGENPKWQVFLNDAASVCFLTDKKSFCVTMGDGGLLFLDACDLEEAEEWVRCLNAVLYAKGIGGESTLQYEVELEASPHLDYDGLAVLELRDHDLIAWKGETWDEIVRWKLNHLRSFKAKKHKLTIVAGKRSSTGHGEFVFKSRHSVQITHAIETVVAKVKYRSSPRASPIPPSSRPIESPLERTLPATTLQRAVPDPRDPLLHSLSSNGGAASGSVIAHIPDFTPPDVYDVIPDNPPSPQEEYGKLEHGMNNMRPKKLMLELEKDRRKRQPSPNSSPPQRWTPPRHGNIVCPSGEDTLQEEYGKLEYANKAKIPLQSPLRIKPSRPGYEDIDLDVPDRPLQSHPRIETTRIKPSRPGYEDIDLDVPDKEGYGRLEKNGSGSPPPLPVPRESRDTSRSPVLGRRLIPPKKPFPYPGNRQSLSPMPQDEAQEGYGQLDRLHTHATQGGRTHPNHTHIAEDNYEALDDAVQLQVVHPEEYTKLSHTQFTSPTEEYGKLDRKRSWESTKKPPVPSPPDAEAEARSRIKLRHAPPQLGSEHENYGKLDRGTSKHGSKPKPAPRQMSVQSPDDGYGRLERNVSTASQFGFDPYGSLPSDAERISITSNTSQDSLTSYKSGPGDTIEEESSTPMYSSTFSKKAEPTDAAEMPVYSSLKKLDPKHKPEAPKVRKESSNGVPPPGYENSKPLGTTAAAKVALITTNGVPPTVPPRGASERNKLHYQNVGTDGKVILDRQPLSDESLVDNEMYSETHTARDNDYVEDVSAVVGTPKSEVAGAIKPLPAPVTMVTEDVTNGTEAGTPQSGGARPLPATKPKVRPRPKRS